MECELSGQLTLTRGIFHSALIAATVSEQQGELCGIKIAGIGRELIGRFPGCVAATGRPEDLRSEAERERNAILILRSDSLDSNESYFRPAVTVHRSGAPVGAYLCFDKEDAISIREVQRKCPTEVITKSAVCGPIEANLQ